MYEHVPFQGESTWDLRLRCPYTTCTSRKHLPYLTMNKFWRPWTFVPVVKRLPGHLHVTCWLPTTRPPRPFASASTQTIAFNDMIRPPVSAHDWRSCESDSTLPAVSGLGDSTRYPAHTKPTWRIYSKWQFGGFQKWGYPKMDDMDGLWWKMTSRNGSFRGTPFNFRKHQFVCPKKGYPSFCPEKSCVRSGELDTQHLANGHSRGCWVRAVAQRRVEGSRSLYMRLTVSQNLAQTISDRPIQINSMPSVVL